MRADTPRWSKLEIVGLCAVMVLAGWLRLNHLDLAEFQWDQAEISKWALALGQEGRFAWIGPVSSTSLDTFPAAIWLLAIPYAISVSPVFATGFVAVINLVTVLGCYLITRRWFGREAACVATLLYAVAPWAVLYSRKIWHTVLLPPLVMAYVWTGWLAFVRGRRWALLLHALGLALLVQTHFSTYPFVLLTILWAVVFRKRLDWRLVPVAIGLAALSSVPYLAVDAQKDWVNIRRFVDISRRPTVTTSAAAYNAWITSTGLDLHLMTGPDRYAEFVHLTPNARGLFVVEGVLALLAAALALVQAARRARRGLDDDMAAGLIASTWLLVPVVVLSRGFTVPAPHYFTITFPAQFILIGWLVARAMRLRGRVGRVLRVAAPVLVITIAAAQVYEVVSLFRFVWSRDTVWGYGTPLHYHIEAAETAARLGDEVGDAEVVLLSAGDEPRSFEMPNVADILLYGRPHRAVDVRSTLVFPADPAVYWATYDMTPAEVLLGELSPEATEARIPLREGRRAYRFYRWPGGEPAIPNVQPLPDVPATWSNGARLVGTVLEGDLEPGATMRWTLVWEPLETPSEDVYYHWFNHLLDEEGRLLGQQDGPSLLPAYWRPGDTVLNWFDIDVAADDAPSEYYMRVGMYAYPSLERVHLRGADGEDDAEWLLIGPLTVVGASADAQSD